MGLGLGFVAAVLVLKMGLGLGFVVAVLVLKVFMGLGFVAAGAAKELVVVVGHIGIFMGAAKGGGGGFVAAGGEGLGYCRGCGWVLGDLVAAMGAVGVGGIGYCHGCGWDTNHHKELCISSLKSDPASQQADLEGLAIIAIKLAYENATAIADNILVLSNSNTDTEPSEEQGLDQCMDNYLDAVDQLENAIYAFSKNAYKDVHTWVKAAVADADSCEAAFEGRKSEITHKNKIFRQFVNNTLAILKVLTEK
uniref:Pectinesterase inhibitor domain-containing protein n=1 Tax=Fagus sylvatica TaxID=28930 RepID=A0A2N9IB23_FAGSY